MNALATVQPASPAMFGKNIGAMRSLPIGGKIRPGIMVPNSKHKDNDALMKIYRDGVALGFRFNDINHNIEKALGIKNALIPKNTPFFHLRGGDFLNPDLARVIKEKYADKGDGRLYRFPVVFPSDYHHQILPEELACYTQAGKKYWRVVETDGVARCKTRTSPIDENGKVSRVYGGRDVVNRPENGGLCQPGKCEQYQKKECTSHASFVFYIPGVDSVRPLEIPTGSFYSRDDVMQMLEMIAGIKGTVTGAVSGKQTFWLSKVLREVTQIQDGKPVKRQAYLMSLTADVDVGTMLVDFGNRPAMEQKGAAAAAMLTPTLTVVGPNVSCDERGGTMAVPIDSVIAPDVPVVAAAIVAESTAPKMDSATSFNELTKSLNELGIPIGEFAAGAAKRYGSAWMTDISILSRAREAIQGMRNLRDEIDKKVAELEIPAETFSSYASKLKGTGWNTKLPALTEMMAELNAVTEADVYQELIIDALT